MLGFGLLFGAGAAVEASSVGITGFSGDPSSGGLFCDQCHTGGNVPVVNLNGPTTVAPGSLNTFTLVMTFGQVNQGGLDVAASTGTLSVNPGDGGTRAQNGEITHTAPRSVSGFPPSIVWSFDWTAPLSPGTATIYAAGNSTDNAQGTNGDAPAVTTLQVMVAGASGTPGETSAPGAHQPLRVTGYNNLTGEISISYESSCETDQNNIYYGALGDVSTWNWTDEVCDVGTGGTAAFTPIGDSIFFVVVGNKNGDDGSYGRSSVGTERSPILLNVCGEVQDLSSTCIP